MILREMMQSDMDFVAKYSISRGVFSKQPEIISFSYALEHEGNILATGGIQLLNPTTGQCWIDLSSFAGKHIIIVYRTIKEWMEVLCKEKKIKRLQAYIETDFEEALRTIKHLGFEYENTAEKFFGDKDGWIYVKFFGD